MGRNRRTSAHAPAAVAVGGDVSGPITIHHTAAAGEPRPSSAGVSVRPPYGLLPRRVCGRSTVTGQLVGALTRGGTRPPGNLWLLHGLGGVGKSTVALEVARQAKRAHHPTFWVDAGSRFSVEAGMQQVAALLAREQGAAPGSALGVDDVWATLERSRRRWLLVFDNADDPQALAAEGHTIAAGNGWLRPSAHGLVLVTSRVAEPAVWGGRCSPVPVRPLDPGQGARLLLDLVTPPDRPWSENRDEARALAERLGGLPLALRAAGRYLEWSVRQGGPTRSFAEYGSQLDAGFGELIDAATRRRYRLEGLEPDPRELVMATWELSLAFLEKQGFPEARALLAVVTGFGGDGVPPALLARIAEAAASGPRRLRFALDDLVGAGNRLTTPGAALDELVSAAADLGLIDITVPGTIGGTEWTTAIGAHPLVTDVVQDRLAADEPLKAALDELAARAATAALQACSPDDPETWWKTMRLRPHVDAVARAVVDGRARLDPRTLRTLTRTVATAAGHLVWMLPSRPGLASLLLYRDLAATVQGRRAAPVRMLTNQVGRRLWELGRHGEALTAWREALPGPVRLLWRFTPQVSAEMCLRLNRLARPVGAAAGHLPDPLAFPPEVWTRVANTVFVPGRTWRRQMLAESLQAEGRFAEAESLFTALLPELVRRRGADHPDVLRVRANLAHIALATQRPGDAARTFRTVHENSRRTLGDDHPETLIARHNFATALHQQGRYAEAERENRELLSVRRRVLGDEHPHTLASRGSLAADLYALDRLVEAEPENRLVVTGRRSVLGDDHPETLTARFNLANTLCQQDGSVEEAEQEYRAVAAAREVLLGADHPDTLHARHGIAIALCKLRRLDDAEREARQVLAERRRVLGDDDPQTLKTWYELGAVLQLRGESAAAEVEHRALYAARARVLGPTHGDTVNVARRLGADLRQLGRHRDAQAVLAPVLDALQETRGDDDPDTRAVRDDLAASRRAQKGRGAQPGGAVRSRS